MTAETPFFLCLGGSPDYKGREGSWAITRREAPQRVQASSGRFLGWGWESSAVTPQAFILFLYSSLSICFLDPVRCGLGKPLVLPRAYVLEVLPLSCYLSEQLH